MAHRRFLPLLLISLSVAASTGGVMAREGAAGAPGAAAALAGMGFTYQGHLRNAAGPVTAACDFEFSLHDAGSGGAQVGTTQRVPGVAVEAGRFTVTLNGSGLFGPRAFDGSARWLAIAVRCPAGEGDYTALNPRQPLTAVPLALSLPGLRTEPNADSPNVVGGHISNTVTLGVVGAAIGGGGNAGDQANSVSATYGTISGGAANQTSGLGATVGGGFSNLAGDLGATVAGGESNVAAGWGATIGGGAHNAVTTASPLAHATIAGGLNNRVSGIGAAVGGGFTNTASAAYATIAGGYLHAANGSYATVGGGNNNAALGEADTVSGGLGNVASGSSATVGGGRQNAATGAGATVPGGSSNLASGASSFAAGASANAAHAGAFVWNCHAACASTTSGAENQFVVNAAGGLWLGKGGGATGPSGAIAPGQLISTSAGAYLNAAGVWTDVSDRDAKTGFAPVDGHALLAALMSLPIESWSFKAEEAGVRHIGPAAQDFHAAFGVGANGTHLAALDTSGVALAAVQQVYAVLQARDAALATQAAQIEALEARLRVLEASAGQLPDLSFIGLPWLLLGGLVLLNVGGLAGYALAWLRRRR